MNESLLDLVEKYQVGGLPLSTLLSKLAKALDETIEGLSAAETVILRLTGEVTELMEEIKRERAKNVPEARPEVERPLGSDNSI